MAETLLPADWTIGVWLSEAYIKTGEPYRGRPILRRLLSVMGAGEAREKIEKLLEQIDAGKSVNEVTAAE